MSLGISGIGLSRLAVLAPFQPIFQLFAIVMLVWAHVRLDRKQTRSQIEVYLLWLITAIVALLFLSPLLTRWWMTF